MKHKKLIDPCLTFYAEALEAYELKRLPNYDGLYDMFDSYINKYNEDETDFVTFHWLNFTEKDFAQLPKKASIKSMNFGHNGKLPDGSRFRCVDVNKRRDFQVTENMFEVEYTQTQPTQPAFQPAQNIFQNTSSDSSNSRDSNDSDDKNGSGKGGGKGGNVGQVETPFLKNKPIGVNVMDEFRKNVHSAKGNRFKKRRGSVLQSVEPYSPRQNGFIGSMIQAVGIASKMILGNENKGNQKRYPPSSTRSPPSSPKGPQFPPNSSRSPPRPTRSSTNPPSPQYYPPSSSKRKSG